MRFLHPATRLLPATFLFFTCFQAGTSDADAVGVRVTSLDYDGTARYIVPENGALGQTWTMAGFDDTSWSVGDGPFGFGYDTSSLAPTTDLEAAMSGINPSAYFRFSFDLSFSNSSQLEALSLAMYYDDGFVAFINGTQVASSNVAGIPAWDSEATVSRTVNDADPPVEFDLTAFTGSLISGTNVLAIQGLNLSVANNDFLIAPILEVTINSIPEPQAPLLLIGGTLLACRRRVCP